MNLYSSQQQVLLLRFHSASKSGAGPGAILSSNGTVFIPASAVDDTFFRRYMHRLYTTIKCRHIFLAIDACYSGTFDPNWFNRPKSYGTRAGELDATAKLQANYDAKKTRMFFTSATEVQSPEVSSFAKKLKEGLLSGGGWRPAAAEEPLISTPINP